VHDNQVVGQLLQAPRPALAVAADRAYDGKRARQQIKEDGAVAVIPTLAGARKKARCPKRIYRQRHKIEIRFCPPKDWRRLVTRYDKLAPFLAAASLIAALYWALL
jgi:transposase